MYGYSGAHATGNVHSLASGELVYPSSYILVLLHRSEREFFIDNILVRIHSIIMMMSHGSLNFLLQVALHLPVGY